MAQAQPSGESAGLRLRYGFAPGQSWRAVYEVTRETQLGDLVERDRGVARFAYRVREGAQKGFVRIEAQLVSQETAAGVSPLDFSPIVFRASADARGRLLASAAITFVTIRGAARRLVTGLLGINPPDVVRRVFPAYTA